MVTRNPMDAVQQQIVALSHKVDALYQLVEPLSRQISEVASHSEQTSSPNSDHCISATNSRPHYYQNQSFLKSVMEHKDILSDNNSEINGSYHSGENSLSPEIQVQRLTAQLTAAYNRIAALEEQLLARRIHS
ncbi:hypothetical protein [Lyngbya aestuarii]|uniref:hypothetical protein n=1 Tax=Lyngbya aestuarii TaxID=118322 RepID=UPI00403DE3C6